MKKKVKTDDRWESGLFKSEADYKEFIARTREKLAVLKRRIVSCPKKQTTARDRLNIPEVDLILNANISVSEPQKRHHLVDDKDHARGLKAHDKNLKKRRRPNIDKDHHYKEKLQRKEKALSEGPEIMPRWLREAVEKMGGYGQRLLIEKRLSASDVNINQNRISMPVRQLKGPDDFLREEELGEVLRRKDDDDKRIEGLNMTFVEAGLRTTVLSLRRWNYGSSSSYVFAGKLKEFVRRNGLKAGEAAQILFFRRRDGNPHFALVNLAAEAASSSSLVVTTEENQATSLLYI